MDLKETQIREMQICEDLSEGFALFLLDDLDTKEEISEGISHISELGMKYRHVHVELKNNMDERAHKLAYQKYPGVCDQVRNY